MPTIDNLALNSGINSSDQIPIWSVTDGVTRRISVSALDARYQLPDQVTADLYRFIGISATPPLTRANGDGLQLGDIYTDTQTEPITWIYSVSGWVPFEGSLSVDDRALLAQIVQEATASANASATSASQSSASASASATSAQNALAYAAALDASAAALAAGIVTFNQFDLGFVADTPPTTTIDLGTVP